MAVTQDRMRELATKIVSWFPGRRGDPAVTVAEIRELAQGTLDMLDGSMPDVPAVMSQVAAAVVKLALDEFKMNFEIALRDHMTLRAGEHVVAAAVEEVLDALREVR